jgi:hypothetical protein
MGAQAGGFSWSPAQHAHRLSIVFDLVNRGGGHMLIGSLKKDV